MNQFYPLIFVSLFKTPPRFSQPCTVRKKSVEEDFENSLKGETFETYIEPKEDLNIAQNTDNIPCMTCHRTHVREEHANENISPICSDMLAFSRCSDFGDSTKRCKRKEQRVGGVGG